MMLSRMSSEKLRRTVSRKYLLATKEATDKMLAVKEMPLHVRIYMEQQAVPWEENKSVAVQVLSKRACNECRQQKSTPQKDVNKPSSKP